MTRSIWPDWRAVSGLALPMVIGSLSNILLGVADTAIVGRLGVDALATVAVAAAVFSLVSELVGAAAIGFQIRAARLSGAGARAQLTALLGHALVRLLVVALMGLALLLSSRPLVALLAGQPDLVEPAMEYLWFRSPGLLFFALGVPIRMTLDVSRQTRWGMYAALISQAINVTLTYALVFGTPPFSALGVTGSAIGSSVAALVGLLFLAAALARSRLLSRPDPPASAAGRTEVALAGRLSLPEMWNVGLDYAGNLVFVYLAGLLGSYRLAGGRIASTLVVVLFVVAMNFGVALQILMGRYLGRRDAIRARRTLDHGRLLVLLIFVALGVLVFAGADLIVSLFIGSTDLTTSTSGALRVVAASLPLMAWATSHVGALRALGRTRWVMVSNVAAVWLVQLPVAWLFGIRWGLDLGGIFLGYFAYFLVRAVAGHRLAVRALRDRETPGTEAASAVVPATASRAAPRGS